MDQNLKIYAPINKKDPSKHMVWGIASTESLDSQGEVVKASAIKAAVSDYMKYANVREMHQPSAVGKTVEMTIDKQGRTHVGVKVVDDRAWQKVEEGVYNGFSIGGHVLTKDDNSITSLTLSEISLVDRPANPDAVFELWKRDSSTMEKKTFDTKTRRELAAKGKAMPDGSFPITDSEDVQNAVHDWGRAGSKPDVKAHIIRRAKALNATDSLPDEWTKVTKPTMKKGTGDAQAILQHIAHLEGMADNEQAEGDEATHSALRAGIASLKQAASSEVTEDEANDSGDYGSGNQYALSEKPSNLKKVVDEKISKGQMPTNEEVDALIKLNEMPVNDKMRSIMKFELAGLIVKRIEAQMHKQQNVDALKKQAEKALNETPANATSVGERKNFKKILDLIAKAEEDMTEEDDLKDGDMSEGNVSELDDFNPDLPEAEESYMDTDGNSAQSDALGMLQSVVDMLNAKGMGGALTQEEIQSLQDGVKAGSTMTGGNQMEDQNYADTDGGTADRTGINPIEGKGATMAYGAKIGNLQKVMKKREDLLLAKIAGLEEKYEKLAKTAQAIKVKANYSTIEKANGLNEKENELSKAEKRADELFNLMKVDPTNIALQDEAKTLSPHIMKLRREVRV